MIILFAILSLFTTHQEAEAYTAQSGGIWIEACSEGGQSIGHLDPDYWLDYNIPIGSYKISFRVATPYNYQQLKIGSSLVSIPNTGGWQTWKTVTANIDIGTGLTRISSPTARSGLGSFNFNWFELELIDTVAVIPPMNDTIFTTKIIISQTNTNSSMLMKKVKWIRIVRTGTKPKDYYYIDNTGTKVDVHEYWFEDSLNGTWLKL